MGKTFGSNEFFERVEQANRNPPQMKAFDRYGNRINQVEYHPAYHELMELAISNEVPNFALESSPARRTGGERCTDLHDESTRRGSDVSDGHELCCRADTQVDPQHR